ncbi:hypothetical protein [Streptomyces bambusae]
MDISGFGLRALRAALFSAVVVLLSSASHVLTSQTPLPVVLVGGLGGTVFALAYALGGREHGYWRIAGLLVPLELAADTAFTAGQHVCYGPAGGPVSGPLRALGLFELCGIPLGTPLAQVAGRAAEPAGALLASADPLTPWLLLAGHCAVGLAAAFWLWRGERALGRLVRAVAACAFRPLLLVVAAAAAGARSARRAPRAARSAPAAVRSRFPVHSVGRRGPPVPAPFGA